MNWKKVKVISSLFILVVPAGIFAMGSNMLEKEIIARINLPLGNILASIALICCAYLAFVLYPDSRKSALRIFLKKAIFFNIILACCWGPLSYLMAGNWAFAFNNQNTFYIWIAVTAFIALFPLVVVILLTVLKLFGSN